MNVKIAKMKSVISHITKTCPCNQHIFLACKNEKFHRKNFDNFRIFAQNIDCGYTSTHNLCFGAKIGKIGIPLHTPVLLYKSGVQEGTHYTDMFSCPDDVFCHQMCVVYLK